MAPPQGLVFRDAIEEGDVGTMRTEVAADLAAARGPGDPEALLVTPLLSAAALEGALDDAGVPSAMDAVTDRIAEAYWRRDPSHLPHELPTLPPARLRVSRPEGFAYYALVPRALAEAALDAGLSDVTVVGIRTIGVALAAVVRAALGGERLTVRPRGHPYDRTTTLTPQQRERVVRRRAGDRRFVVVDEGPGLSGSSLLSVGEALVAEGVPADRVWLLGTRVVDPAALVTSDGAARWARFRSLAVPPGRRWPAASDGADLSGGAWRARFWGDEARWPSAWTTLERLKRLSRDGAWLWKFEGLGRYGAEVHARAEALARAGWTPAPSAPPDGLGFVPYPFAGPPLVAGARDAALLATLGIYCADRVALFPRTPDLAALSAMVRTNVALEGVVQLPDDWQLPCERPIVADGRMLPHEWLRGPEGRLQKSDGAAHGDDHLYPGPVDVAWDLAGAIVEWDLDGGERAALLASYRARSGDDAAARLPAHEVAYAAFRACACGMAAASTGADEATRLLRDRERYRRRLRAGLAVIAPRRA